MRESQALSQNATKMTPDAMTPADRRSELLDRWGIKPISEQERLQSLPAAPPMPAQKPGESRLEWWERAMESRDIFASFGWASQKAFWTWVHSAPRGRRRSPILDQAEMMRSQGKPWSQVYAEVNVTGPEQKALRDALRQRRARAKQRSKRRSERRMLS